MFTVERASKLAGDTAEERRQRHQREAMYAHEERGLIGTQENRRLVPNVELRKSNAKNARAL